MNAKKIGSITQSSIKILSPSGASLVTGPCYIYGIAEFGKQVLLKSSGIDSPASKVYTIPFKDISALVSRTKYDEYDPSDENVLAHNEVVQEAHSEFGCTVLPLRFSTIAKSEIDVMKILSNGYSKFKQKLQSLKGKTEMAVKVYCKIDSFRKSILAEGRLADSKAVDEEMRRRTLFLANKLVNRLGLLSVDHVLNDLVFDDLILNAAFLIDERRVRDFMSLVTDFESQNRKNIKLEWSGPYVPYSFTDPPK
ncbi:MAG: GvpL/GvpF family gas vesicle protein [archaeon]|nr:GvpL/GvpF family gas vesicle protein [archaeon]